MDPNFFFFFFFFLVAVKIYMLTEKTCILEENLVFNEFRIVRNIEK